METNSREVHGQPSIKLHTTLDSLDQLGNIRMARVETRAGVDDSDDGAGEGIVAVAGGFDEDFAEEEGEVRVPVIGEAGAEAGR